jgi:hypothetical protein
VTCVNQLSLARHHGLGARCLEFGHASPWFPAGPNRSQAAIAVAARKPARQASTARNLYFAALQVSLRITTAFPGILATNGSPSANRATDRPMATVGVFITASELLLIPRR